MQLRSFGRTGLKLSALGFGCGAVGGLMVRGEPGDRERTIARAIAVGINYFDTAVQYGNGESEKNLGLILQKLRPSNIVVGTKVRLPPANYGRITEAIVVSLEGSLRRLQRDQVDILHLHNPVTENGGGVSLSVRQVMEEVVPAFEVGAIEEEFPAGLFFLGAKSVRLVSGNGVVAIGRGQENQCESE